MYSQSVPYFPNERKSFLDISEDPSQNRISERRRQVTDVACQGWMGPSERGLDGSEPKTSERISILGKGKYILSSLRYWNSILLIFILAVLLFIL